MWKVPWKHYSIIKYLKGKDQDPIQRCLSQGILSKTDFNCTNFIYKVEHSSNGQIEVYNENTRKCLCVQDTQNAVIQACSADSLVIASWMLIHWQCHWPGPGRGIVHTHSLTLQTGLFLCNINSYITPSEVSEHIRQIFGHICQFDNNHHHIHLDSLKI